MTFCWPLGSQVKKTQVVKSRTQVVKSSRVHGAVGQPTSEKKKAKKKGSRRKDQEMGASVKAIHAKIKAPEAKM